MEEYLMDFNLEKCKKEFAELLDAKLQKAVTSVSNESYDVNVLDPDIEWYLSVVKEREESANQTYVPEFFSDIIFGDDSWAPRVRFEKQKQHLESTLDYKIALSFAETANNLIDEKIDELEKPKTPAEDKFTPELTRYCKDEAEKFGRENTAEEIKKYNFRGYGARTGNFVAGMVMLGVGFLTLFIGLILLSVMKDLRLKEYGVYITIIVGVILFFIGILVAIPAWSLMAKKRAAFENRRRLIARTNTHLQLSLRPLVNEYNTSYRTICRQMELECKQPVIDRYKKLREENEEKRKDLFYRCNDRYAFAANYDITMIKEILEAMTTGVADSYSSALKFVLDQRQKEADREELREERRMDREMKMAHNEKMEKMAEEQLRSQWRTEEATRNMASYARQAAYESARQTELARQQAKYAKTQAKAVQEMERRTSSNGVGIKVNKD